MQGWSPLTGGMKDGCFIGGVDLQDMHSTTPSCRLSEKESKNATNNLCIFAYTHVRMHLYISTYVFVHLLVYYLIRPGGWVVSAPVFVAHYKYCLINKLRCIGRAGWGERIEREMS